MTLKESQARFGTLTILAARHDKLDLAAGYLRYEALRKLDWFAFKDLCARNIRGENFDDMVDELVLKGKP
jgi:hypothetical protein